MEQKSGSCQEGQGNGNGAAGILGTGKIRNGPVRDIIHAQSDIIEEREW